jgi:DNA-binding phage protein
MATKPRSRQPFIRRGADTTDIWLEDLRGQVWNSSRDQNLSWKDIAIRSGITSQTIAKFAYFETKRPMFNTVFKIAEALGIKKFG